MPLRLDTVRKAGYTCLIQGRIQSHASSGRIAMASPSPATRTASCPRAPATPSVLVVDDDPGVRRLLDRALPLHGFRVRLAAGGPEALDVFEAHHPDIDLVLLDVRMPTLDGPATLAALARIKPDVRCVFMSGDTGD